MAERLSDHIVNGGPYAPGDKAPAWTGDLLRAEALNELRDELVELRRLREVMARFTVEAITLCPGTADITLHHGCRAWWVDIAEPRTLAELVQRAGEHAEVCR